jgi:enolase
MWSGETDRTISVRAERASVPTGSSTGLYEAVELRDGGLTGEADRASGGDCQPAS